MKHKGLPSIERLGELFAYNPEDGRLVWIKKPSAKAPVTIGSEAGCLTRFGYRIVTVDCVQIQTHRIAWALSNNAWPERQIDHINGLRDDNRLANLREATPAENCRNRKTRIDNTSGFTGVDWCTRRQKWRAKLKTDGVTRTPGLFRSMEAAKSARLEAERQYYGAYAPQRT